MKRLLLCLLVGTVCLAKVANAEGQGKGSRQSPTRGLSGVLCKAVEHYIAAVSAAAATKDRTRREQEYAEAYKALESVGKDKDKQSVLDEASAYARYSELITVGDPTDKGFGDLLEKRTKSASTLLDMCMAYTISR